MTNKRSKPGKIIIPAGMKPSPRQHEIDVANILAEHFKADVEFIPTTSRRTPDFMLNGISWELKSPQGKGRNNIERQLKYAGHQSPNVIIDASRSKMHANKVRREVEYQFRLVKSVKRLLFISRTGKVFEMTK